MLEDVSAGPRCGRPFDALVHACHKTLLGSRQWTVDEILAWGRSDIDTLKAMERGSCGGSGS